MAPKGFVTTVVDLIEKHKVLCVAISFISVIALAPGLTLFSEKYDVRIWFRETDPLIQTLNSFERQFGNDESIVIGLKAKGGIFSPKAAKAVKEITEKLWLVPQVIRVESLSNYNYSHSEDDDIIVEPFFSSNGGEFTQEYLDNLKQIALNHPVMKNYLISKDGTSALIFARLVTTLSGSPNYKLITEKTQEIAKYYNDVEGLETHVVGEAAVNDAFRSVANSDAAVLMPILFGLIIVYLLITFRSFVAMLFPFGVTLFSLIMTFGTCFYMGFSFDSILSILPAILIAISIADSVHILVTYFNFRADSMTTREAAYMALHKNLIPTFLTSVSTMIGFFSLTFTELVPVRQLGILAGIGCFYAWFITIFLMAPLLFWTSFEVPEHFKKIGKNRKGKIAQDSFPMKAAYFIDKHKKRILVFMALFAVVAVGLSTQIKINSNPYEYFRSHLPIRIANEFTKKEFGGNTGPEFVIDSGSAEGIKDPEFLAKVEKFKDWLDAQPIVNKTVDVIDIIKEVNQNIFSGLESEYKIPESNNRVAENLLLYSMGLPQGMDLKNRMTLSNDKMRMSVLWSVYDTRGWLKYIALYEKKAKEFGLEISTTGKFYLFQRMMDYVVMTFLKSITMAMILVAILMMVLFKSIKIGLISLVPNVLPLIFGGAVMAVGGIDLNIGSALVFSVCLGIAVDDTIHFLSNYYRYKSEGMDELQIMATIFTYTGSALVVTTAILASGFGVYIFGDFVPNVNFGVLCAFVLTGALAIDMVFLPALLLWLHERKELKKAGVLAQP